MFSHKKKTVNNENHVINIDENTDYRNVSPFDFSKPDFSLVSREADREFIKKSNPDDRVPDYRDPLIEVDANRFKAILEIEAIRIKEQRLNIQSGAKIQKSKAEKELADLNSLITEIENM